jgi:hypothetical protein
MQVHMNMHRSSQLACRVFVNEVIAGCGCACSRPLALRDGSYAACKDIGQVPSADAVASEALHHPTLILF